MALDPNEPNLAVGVVGAGTMGRGIAQVAAVGGMRVLLFDSRAQAAVEARGFIQHMLWRAAEKGRLAEDPDMVLRRIEPVATLTELGACKLVIEAAIEDLATKQGIFAALEDSVAPECILASNTSSLSITTLASACRHPARIAGMHFFNPVPLMKLVEVIDGEMTAPGVADVLAAIGRRMGREPVRVADAPGFLVNRIGRGFTIEAAHLAEEGIASFADVDRIMRDCAGFRMGPFELMDLTGLDVTHPATQLIYEQSYHESRYRPSQLMRSRAEAGVLGRKTQCGFYAFDEGKPILPAEPAPPSVPPDSVWVSAAEPVGRDRLTALLHQLDSPLELGDRPGPSALCLVTPIGDDATNAALAQGLDPARTVAVDTLFDMAKRRVIMTTPVTASRYRDAAHALLARDGVPVTVLHDSPGFVAQRIVSMIVNIASSIAQHRGATPDDIDKAPRLALNYPMGPLSFGDALGAGRVLRVLQALQRTYGDPRYRPSVWLSRRARLGVSLLTPEA